MKYSYAITREPGVTFDQCISDHPLKRHLNIGQARRQHAQYCKVLEELGVEVFKLPREDKFPDACFVEDTAVIVKDKVFVTRLENESRRGEEEAIIKSLEENYSIKQATPPATIEGGDVIHLEKHLICGITQRTNLQGAKQLQVALEKPVVTLTDESIIHLKSHVTYLGKNTMLVTDKYAEHPVLKDFEKLVVHKHERYAANSLTVNDVVLLPKLYTKTHQLVKNAGFNDIMILDTSEFEKCEGALTCLSLIF